MKVVFLDIDGVLNYTQWYVSDRNPGNLDGKEGDIDPLCADRINLICEKTGAKIVLSSDWRINWPYCIDRLEKAGIKQSLVIDKTPEHMWVEHCGKDFLDYTSRGSEIDDWLSRHPECDRYVILDDRKDFTEEQKINFVHINSMYGIDDTDVDFAIQILNR
jgi:hypothetical protein